MNTKKYTIPEKIKYAKLAQNAAKSGIPMTELSKMVSVSDVTLAKWLKLYEAGQLDKQSFAQELGDIGSKIDVTNEILRGGIEMIKSKADEFIEAVRVLGDKLDDPHEPEPIDDLTSEEEKFEEELIAGIENQNGEDNE